MMLVWISFYETYVVTKKQQIKAYLNYIISGVKNLLFHSLSLTTKFLSYWRPHFIFT